MRKYDPNVIQQAADQAYSLSSSIVYSSVLIGLLIGGLAGYGLAQDLTVAIVGAVITGGIGYAIGAERALKLKFEVQLALCLAEIEKNTRQTARVVDKPNEKLPPTDLPKAHAAIEKAAPLFSLKACPGCASEINGNSGKQEIAVPRSAVVRP